MDLWDFDSWGLLNPYEFLVLIPLGIGLPQQILMDKSDLHMTSAMCTS